LGRLPAGSRLFFARGLSDFHDWRQRAAFRHAILQPVLQRIQACCFDVLVMRELVDATYVDG